MQLQTPPSDLLVRNRALWKGQTIAVAGDCRDPHFLLDTESVSYVWTTHYDLFRHFSAATDQMVEFSMDPNPGRLAVCDTVIYYWPKSVMEGQHQLLQLLRTGGLKKSYFLVGSNRSGIRRCETWLTQWGYIKKVDVARRCSLYHFTLKTVPDFDDSGWKTSRSPDGLELGSFPGVFSYGRSDRGSLELLSTLASHPLKKSLPKTLDIGCGQGLLGLTLLSRGMVSDVVFSDVSIAALESVKKNLILNPMLEHSKPQVRTVASDQFSNISETFDLIVTNPPFHMGQKDDHGFGEYFLPEIYKHLAKGGALRLVANSFLPYGRWLNETFGAYAVLKKSPHFTVYEAYASE